MIKKRKLFGLAVVTTAIMIIAIVSIGVTSCSGPEGPIGPEGPQGPAGSTGADGSDGSDGQSGSDGRPAIPVVVYTVTYDTGEDGTKVDSEDLMKGDKASCPENAFRPFTQEQMFVEGAGLYRAGVSNGWILLGWKMEDGSYYDFDKAVNADIHLTADWAMPGKISFDSYGINAIPADADFFDKALDYVIKEPASYYLVIDDDYTSESTKTATVTGISLTIVGIGSERTITCGTGTTDGMLFEINNGARLYLESNVTLKGKSTASAKPLIEITNGWLYMQAGSKITGHNAGQGISTININGATARFVMNGGEISGNRNAGGSSNNSTVIINNSLFTMNGGTITGNTVSGIYGCIRIDSSATTNSSFTMNGGTITGNACVGGDSYSTAGVRIISASYFRMYGGSITGNTGGTVGDVFSGSVGSSPTEAGNIFIRGDAAIGGLTICGVYSSPITIVGTWTGSVQNLNLYARLYDTAERVMSDYNTKVVVAGTASYTLTSADMERFRQVNAMYGSSSLASANITTTTYQFVRTGADMGKILKK
jgi:hypothetical protein